MDWADRVGRRIKLRDLHVLLAVAECGGMAKAAERLAITHPVVSKTISDLEQVLGVRLLDRSARGVELTAYGQALLDCGAAVFDELRQGLRRIEHLAGRQRRGASHRLPRHHDRGGHARPGRAVACACFPKVRLEVVHAETATGQFQPLRERRVDLLVGRLPAHFREEDLAAECLFDEAFVALRGATEPGGRAGAGSNSPTSPTRPGPCRPTTACPAR